MSKIIIEGIKLYAYHGCLEEEARIGCNYEVDVIMDTDFSLASTTDELEQTIDYVIVYELVKKQMQIRSKLIEHVGRRIYNDILKRYPSIIKLKVKVTKINPPMNGEVEKVAVVVDT